MTMRTHHTIRDHVDQYIHYLMQTGHRFDQVIVTHNQLDYFTEWADRQFIRDIDQLEHELAADYLHHLQSEHDLFKERPVGTRVLRERITKLRRFYEWLYRKSHLNDNLSSSVPKITKRGYISTTTRQLSGLTV